MGKLNRAKLRKAAKLAIAIHGYDLIQGCSPDMLLLTNNQYLIMSEEVHKLATKLAGDNPMNFGSINECIEYFRDKE